MKNKTGFYIGLILCIITVVLLMMNIRVGSFSFYRFGFINSGALCIIMLSISIVALLVKPCKVTKFLVAFMIIALILTIILGLHINLMPMSIFDFFLILAPGLIGLAFIIKNLIKN